MEHYLPENYTRPNLTFISGINAEEGSPYYSMLLRLASLDVGIHIPSNGFFIQQTTTTQKGCIQCMFATNEGILLYCKLLQNPAIDRIAQDYWESLQNNTRCQPSSDDMNIIIDNAILAELS